MRRKNTNQLYHKNKNSAWNKPLAAKNFVNQQSVYNNKKPHRLKTYHYDVYNRKKFHRFGPWLLENRYKLFIPYVFMRVGWWLYSKIKYPKRRYLLRKWIKEMQKYGENGQKRRHYYGLLVTKKFFLVNRSALRRCRKTTFLSLNFQSNFRKKSRPSREKVFFFQAPRRGPTFLKNRLRYKKLKHNLYHQTHQLNKELKLKIRAEKRAKFSGRKSLKCTVQPFKLRGRLRFTIKQRAKLRCLVESERKIKIRKESSRYHLELKCLVGQFLRLKNRLGFFKKELVKPQSRRIKLKCIVQLFKSKVWSSLFKKPQAKLERNKLLVLTRHCVKLNRTIQFFKSEPWINFVMKTENKLRQSKVFIHKLKALVRKKALFKKSKAHIYHLKKINRNIWRPKLKIDPFLFKFRKTNAKKLIFFYTIRYVNGVFFFKRSGRKHVFKKQFENNALFGLKHFSRLNHNLSRVLILSLLLNTKKKVLLFVNHLLGKAYNPRRALSRRFRLMAYNVYKNNLFINFGGMYKPQPNRKLQTIKLLKLVIKPKKYSIFFYHRYKIGVGRQILRKYKKRIGKGRVRARAYHKQGNFNKRLKFWYYSFLKYKANLKHYPTRWNKTEVYSTIQYAHYRQFRYKNKFKLLFKGHNNYRRMKPGVVNFDLCNHKNGYRIKRCSKFFWVISRRKRVVSKKYIRGSRGCLKLVRTKRGLRKHLKLIRRDYKRERYSKFVFKRKNYFSKYFFYSGRVQPLGRLKKVYRRFRGEFILSNNVGYRVQICNFQKKKLNFFILRAGMLNKKLSLRHIGCFKKSILKKIKKKKKIPNVIFYRKLKSFTKPVVFQKLYKKKHIGTFFCKILYNMFTMFSKLYKRSSIKRSIWFRNRSKIIMKVQPILTSKLYVFKKLHLTNLFIVIRRTINKKKIRKLSGYFEGGFWFYNYKLFGKTFVVKKLGTKKPLRHRRFYLKRIKRHFLRLRPRRKRYFPRYLCKWRHFYHANAYENKAYRFQRRYPNLWYRPYVFFKSNRTYLLQFLKITDRGSKKIFFKKIVLNYVHRVLQTKQRVFKRLKKFIYRFCKFNLTRLRRKKKLRNRGRWKGVYGDRVESSSFSNKLLKVSKKPMVIYRKVGAPMFLPNSVRNSSVSNNIRPIHFNKKMLKLWFGLDKRLFTVRLNKNLNVFFKLKRAHNFNNSMKNFLCVHRFLRFFSTNWAMSNRFFMSNKIINRTKYILSGGIFGYDRNFFLYNKKLITQRLKSFKRTGNPTCYLNSSPVQFAILPKKILIKGPIWGCLYKQNRPNIFVRHFIRKKFFLRTVGQRWRWRKQAFESVSNHELKVKWSKKKFYFLFRKFCPVAGWYKWKFSFIAPRWTYLFGYRKTIFSTSPWLETLVFSNKLYLLRTHFDYYRAKSLNLTKKYKQYKAVEMLFSTNPHSVRRETMSSLVLKRLNFFYFSRRHTYFFKKIKAHSIRSKYRFSERQSFAYYHFISHLSSLVYQLNFAPTIGWAINYTTSGFVFYKNIILSFKRQFS